MAPITPFQRAERYDFVLNRLKRGFSREAVAKMMAVQFGITKRRGYQWVNAACDYLAQTQDDTDRLRAYATVVEMMHDQIVSYQAELLEIDSVLQALDKQNITRDEILEEIRTAAPDRQHSLEAELRHYPPVLPQNKARTLELKSVVRARMQQAIRDLARLRGLHLTASDWRQALNTLLDSNLIPTSVAETILEAISEFDCKIQQSGTLEENLE